MGNGEGKMGEKRREREEVGYRKNENKQRWISNNLLTLKKFDFAASFVHAADSRQAGRFTYVLPNLISDYSFYDVPSDCYKFAANISILMNPNSHFGYQMSPLCLLNATQCAERISTTNRNYLSSVNRIEPLLLLPAYDFDPKNFSLYNNVKNISFQTINQLNLREAFNI